MAVLVIDDDPDALRLVDHILRHGGHTDVELAEGLDAGWRLLRPRGGAPRFDVVLLDLTLADGDGFGLLERMRTHRDLRDLPVVVVTARSDDDTVAAVFESGAVDYVPKPPRPAELLARVGAAIRLKRERERRSTREQRLVLATQKLTHKNETLELLTLEDPLTQLANRRHFQTIYRAEWRRSIRAREPVGVILLDVDHFHAFNETYGHLAGDECLKQLAAALRADLRRSSDLLARYGGEEFVVVLPNTDVAGTHVVADHLRRAVETLALPHAGEPSGVVTISAGAASLVPAADMAPETLLRLADEALYRAKAAGRNAVRAA